MRFAARVAFEIVPALILATGFASCRSSVEPPLRSSPPVDRQTGGLRIQVLDGADHKPLPGATIVLTSAAGPVPESERHADIDGIAYFPILPPGEGYVVLVTMPGYVTARRDEIGINTGAMQTLVITLREDEASHGLYPATTASVSGFGRPAGAAGRENPSETY